MRWGDPVQLPTVHQPAVNTCPRTQFNQYLSLNVLLACTSLTLSNSHKHRAKDDFGWRRFIRMFRYQFIPNFNLHWGFLWCQWSLPSQTTFCVRTSSTLPSYCRCSIIASWSTDPSKKAILCFSSATHASCSQDVSESPTSFKKIRTN